MKSVARDGAQTVYPAYAAVKRMPAAARASRCGVCSQPGVVNEGSPTPRSSAMIHRMLGRVGAASVCVASVGAAASAGAVAMAVRGTCVASVASTASADGSVATGSGDGPPALRSHTWWPGGGRLPSHHHSKTGAPCSGQPCARRSAACWRTHASHGTPRISAPGHSARSRPWQRALSGSAETWAQRPPAAAVHGSTPQSSTSRGGGGAWVEALGRKNHARIAARSVVPPMGGAVLKSRFSPWSRHDGAKKPLCAKRGPPAEIAPSCARIQPPHWRR